MHDCIYAIEDISRHISNIPETLHINHAFRKCIRRGQAMGKITCVHPN